jgi:hypothetical protein
MALDDRDRSLEKALARHLRYIAPAGGDADSPVSMPCPDSEILAAYHDGSLGADELALWKQHVVSCETCQLILEHLAAPLDVATGQQSTQQVPAAQAASASPHQLQSSAPSRTTPSAPAPVTEIRPRKVYLRWLAPAGAIAAVLLVMLVVERSRPVFRSESERIETASNRQPVPVAPLPAASSSAESDSVRARQVSPKDAAEERAKGPASSVGSASGNLPSRASELKSQREAGRPAQQTPYLHAQNSAHGPAVSQQQQQRQMASGFGEGHGVGPALDKKKKDEAPTVPAVSEAGRDLSAKALPAAPAPPSVLENQPSFLANDSLSRSAADKTAPAPAPATSAKARAGVAGGAASGAMAQTVTVETSSTAAMNVRADAFPTAPIFGPPAGNVLWRVGAAGSIEHSTDSGTTWSMQASGVSANLITGFALSPKVCWVVGASGIILRTTDGGGHWIKISSPVAADLMGIRSTDAFHATVWFIDDPKTGAIKSFKTSDGGISWSPGPNQ